MTEPERPAVRPPDIWGGGPGGEAVGGVPGRQVDPARDPDRYDAGEPVVPPGRLDPALDPDRYDASEVPPPSPGSVRLDPARDPDRFGGDRTLTELLGEGAQEEPRDSYVWLVGLLSVLAFLALVAFVASNLGP